MHTALFLPAALLVLAWVALEPLTQHSRYLAGHGVPGFVAAVLLTAQMGLRRRIRGAELEPREGLFALFDFARAQPVAAALTFAAAVFAASSFDGWDRLWLLTFFCWLALGVLGRWPRWLRTWEGSLVALCVAVALVGASTSLLAGAWLAASPWILLAAGLTAAAARVLRSAVRAPGSWSPAELRRVGLAGVLLAAAASSLLRGTPLLDQLEPFLWLQFFEYGGLPYVFVVLWLGGEAARDGARRWARYEPQSAGLRLGNGVVVSTRLWVWFVTLQLAGSVLRGHEDGPQAVHWCASAGVLVLAPLVIGTWLARLPLPAQPATERDVAARLSALAPLLAPLLVLALLRWAEWPADWSRFSAVQGLLAVVGPQLA